MNQPKIVLYQHANICYAEFEGGRHGARGTGTTLGEALLSLMVGSQSLIGITIEREAVMPPPAEAATDCGEARYKFQIVRDSRYPGEFEIVPIKAATRRNHTPLTDREMAAHAANFAPEDVP